MNATITNQFYSDWHQVTDEDCWCCLCAEEQNSLMLSVSSMSAVEMFSVEMLCNWLQSWETVVKMLWEESSCYGFYVKICKVPLNIHSYELIDEDSDCSWCLQNSVSEMFELWPCLHWQLTFHLCLLAQKIMGHNWEFKGMWKKMWPPDLNRFNKSRCSSWQKLKRKLERTNCICGFHCNTL